MKVFSTVLFANKKEIHIREQTHNIHTDLYALCMYVCVNMSMSACVLNCMSKLIYRRTDKLVDSDINSSFSLAIYRHILKVYVSAIKYQHIM